eukprot:TRINITY_DN283_c0_g1_i8.p1 TRINITY_DN283_c0_g1~~TRINITY_DN283_c0_g1_i8.p1  ORF type:complete len:786 (-),score=227.35 TRINITY_DN283_c0_g1_i8:1919-4276(-)
MENVTLCLAPLVLLLLGGPAASKPTASLSCIYNNKTNPYFHREEVPSSDLITDSQGRLLISGCSACFTLWSSSPEGSRTLLGQGCWSSQENCLESSCNDYSVDGMAANKAKFCCCSAQLCNAHILPPLREGSPKKEEQEVLPSSQNTLNQSVTKSGIKTNANSLPLILIPVSAVIFILLLSSLLSFSFLAHRFTRRLSNAHTKPSLNNNNNNSSLSEAAKLLHPRRNIREEDLEVTPETRGGSFGFSGMERSTGARVLLSVPEAREVYLHEAAIYEALPPHPGLLRLLYHGEDVICRGGVHLDRALVFCNSGSVSSLSSYLRENTLTWSRLLKCLTSLTDALAHIHSDSLSTPNPSLSSICHRNLSSESVLVRCDGSLCIGDFSRAVRVSGCSVLLGEGLSFSPRDPRYLPPEALEGTLNFREAESSLKQGDVYSLGLLFWCLGRRCEELYQGSAVPEFQEPFESELRCPPSPEALRVLVSVRRSRPLFPSVWKDSNPAVQLLRETIEDSWDQDGEARLTASCVRERILELDSLWERYKKHKRNELSPGNNSGANGMDSHCAVNNALPRNNGNQPILIKNDTVFHSNDISVNSSSFSSPDVVAGDVSRRSKNDNVLSNQMPSLRLQPYQGLNPCKERNLKSSELLEPNTLLLHNSSKDFSTKGGTPSGACSITFSGGGSEELSPSSASAAAAAAAPPIPYTQNPLSSSSSSSSGEGTSSRQNKKPLLLSKEHNREKRSHLNWLRSTGRPPKPRPVVFVEAPGKQCNLDIEKSLLSHQVDHIQDQE